MVLYPASHEFRELNSSELSVKIARHSPCSECACDGLRPSEDVTSLVASTGSDSELLTICACSHSLSEHGNSSNIPQTEFERRAKVAIRLDELLEDVGRLLDFEYVDDDIISLRKQMQVVQEQPSNLDSSSSPLSMPDRETPDSDRSVTHIHSPTNSASSSLSDEEEDQPLARRVPAPSAVVRNGKKGNSKMTGANAGKSSLSPVDGAAPSVGRFGREERILPAHLERIATGPTADSTPPNAIRTEKPCVTELRNGLIRVISVELDGTPQPLIILTGLKTLFQKQLPKMPREYISRLVYDHHSRALAIVKNGWKVVGGILFRPFTHRGFAEIVFFATASIDQIKGYGGMLMNYFKMHIKETYPGMMHFLTYADNYAVGYFKKQGFTKDITLDRAVWAGYIKDYEGATILQCSMLPKVDYIRARETLRSQREAIMEKIRSKSRSQVIHRSPFELQQDTKDDTILDPNKIPGLRETGWDFSMILRPEGSSKNPDHAAMHQLLLALQSHPQSWAFLQPVNGEEVTDYYDVVKRPMDFNTMEHKLSHKMYDSMSAFLEDAALVFQNCLLYNPEGSVYAKNAVKMQKFLDDQVAIQAKTGRSELDPVPGA